MKKKTKMRSKKNARKTKRIRGGASHLKRERNNPNGNAKPSQRSRLERFYNAVTDPFDRHGPDELDREFQKAKKNYEDAVKIALPKYTTLDNRGGTFVYEEGLKSVQAVKNALDALRDIDMKIYHRNIHSTPYKLEEYRKTKLKFMEDMNDRTIFDVNFYPIEFREMMARPRPVRSFGRREGRSAKY